MTILVGGNEFLPIGTKRFYEDLLTLEIILAQVSDQVSLIIYVSVSGVRLPAA